MEEIYRAHFGFVWAVLRRLGVPDRDLEDVAQDVFVVVHRRLPEFEGRASTRTWLYAIAVRVAWNHLRRRKLREPAADASGSRLVAPTVGSDPEEHALRTEAGRLLDALLGRLDEDKRAVFVLSDIEGLTAVEIAEIVGTNPRTVYSRLRAARERVHGDLEKMQAREQSAAERRRWLRAASSSDAPTPRAERRVWAALCLRLPETAAIATSGGALATAATGWSTAAQAITISMALGVAGLGAIWIAAAPMRDDAPIEAPAGTPASADDGLARSSAEGGEIVVDPAADPVNEPPAAPAASPSAPATSRRAGRTHAEPPARGDDALARELELLERARDAIARGDGTAAAEALDDHARRFPESALATDRDRLRIKAEAIAAHLP